MTNNAKIIDVSTLIEAGIDPKTGLPIKLTDIDDGNLLTSYTQILKEMDRQDFVNKGT